MKHSTGALLSTEHPADDRSAADQACAAAASYVRPARRVAAVGVIGRARGRTVTTVRTAEGVTGTVTAVAR